MPSPFPVYCVLLHLVFVIVMSMLPVSAFVRHVCQRSGKHNNCCWRGHLNHNNNNKLPLSSAFSSWAPNLLVRAQPWRHHDGCRRLFGSRVSPDNPPGEIALYDEQNHMPDLDVAGFEATLGRIRRAIGYPTYDVTLILVDDREMTKINTESRGIQAPTDILSFPFHAAVSPGVLEDVKFDVPDYYMLVRVSRTSSYGWLFV